MVKSRIVGLFLFYDRIVEVCVVYYEYLGDIEFDAGANNILQLDVDMNLTPYVPPKPPVCIEEKIKEFEEYGGISTKALRRAKLIFDSINKEGTK